MRGLEYLDDDEYKTRGIKKKVKPSKNKKSDHKHDYSIKKLIKDSWANITWEKSLLICTVCGKEKEETKITNP